MEIEVDRIKKRHRSAGFVVLCYGDNMTLALATHRLFDDEHTAKEYAKTVAPSRKAIVFQLRFQDSDDWMPKG